VDRVLIKPLRMVDKELPHESLRLRWAMPKVTTEEDQHDVQDAVGVFICEGVGKDINSSHVIATPQPTSKSRSLTTVNPAPVPLLTPLPSFVRIAPMPPANPLSRPGALLTSLCLLALSLACPLQAADGPDIEGFTSLFNGKDLTGWHRQAERWIHGDGGRWGVTEDNALYGEQEPPGSGNGGLLLTDESYGEFELELSLKPDWGPDSGVFIRTNQRGEGWQIYVDHHDNGNVGHIRLETKAHSVPFRPFGFSRKDPAKADSLAMAPDGRIGNWPEGVYEETCTAEEWLAAWKPDEWNRMKIRCTGKGKFPTIEVWVNDLKVCKLNTATTTHPGLDREKAAEQVEPTGAIGLQVHGGKRWQAGDRVFWKDLRIRKLDTTQS